MNQQVTKVLNLDDAKFYLANGLSHKKIEALFENQDEETKNQIRALLLIEKGKTPAQKAAEHLMGLISGRLTDEFLVYRDDSRTPIPLKRLSDFVVQESSIEGLLEVAANELRKNSVMLSKSKVEELVRTWEMNADSISRLPKSFSLKPDELTFNFIRLEVADGPSPVFDDFIERCGVNGPALMAFIWSIFEDADVQQYVLMHGEGKDGKGSLLRLIEKWVGPRAFTGNSVKDDHWVAKCVGKRVAVWSDVNSTAFVMSDLFKQVTGGDRVTVTEKHKPSYSARLDFRAFIATNNEPELTSRKSDLRRILYVRVAETPGIPDYEQKLESESSAILYKCREKFHELYDPLNKEITCDSVLAKEKAADFEIEFSSIVEIAFEVGPEFTVLNEEAFNEVCRVFKYTSRYGQWKNWLAREHGVTEFTEKVPGRRRPKKYLKGIKLKHKAGN
jgi:hypothetical protein